MKLSKLALVVAMACVTAGNAMADQSNDIQLVSGLFGWGSNKCCDDTCCEDDGCDSRCGSRWSLGKLRMNGITGPCCLGDPYKAFGFLECHGIDAGGWAQIGYSSRALPAFNTLDEIQFQQGWLYAEKATDGSCGLDIGGRADIVYGTDGPNTQAFGSDPLGNGDGGWDNSWDNGVDYGAALPQLYVEAAYGDWKVKAGKFFTTIGYEVVPATGNFFYSHSYTMNFAEPFTHTGVLGEYAHSDDTTIHAGWVLGWDSGFDDNGGAWLGGISHQLTCNLNLAYASSGGRFADNGTQTTRGYMQSVVAQYDVSCDLQYIFQTDWQDTEDAAGATVLRAFGINQYLIKTVNECWAYGGRFEWWQRDIGAVDADLYALTLGVNYRPHANLLFRPELRFDWDSNANSGLLAGGSEQTTFGVDGILTF
jgi:hypothetical protein